MNGLRVGSIFSGIGGFDLGFERAGMRVVWQAESNPFCRAVLRHHWPDVPCAEDVRSIVADTEGWEGWSHGENLPGGEAAWGPRGGGGSSSGGRVPVPMPPIDLLCGGFPCQDISLAGKGGGLDGERSGLWSEFPRLIRLFEPRWVVVENVPALTSRGLDRVLRDLAEVGYDAEWDCLPASAFGAPHRRDRIWIVAYPQGGAGELLAGQWENLRDKPPVDGASRHSGASGERGGAVADPERPRRLESQGDRPGSADSGGPTGGLDGSGWWLTEPDVGRVAARVPARVDRLAALGNALVPQIAEYLGRRIIEAEPLVRGSHW